MSFPVTISSGPAALPGVAGGLLALASGPGPVNVSATAPVVSTLGTGKTTTKHALLASGLLAPGAPGFQIPAGNMGGPIYPPNAITSQTTPGLLLAGAAPDPRMPGAGSVPWPVPAPAFVPAQPIGQEQVGSVTATVTGPPGVYTFTVGGQ